MTVLEESKHWIFFHVILKAIDINPMKISSLNKIILTCYLMRLEKLKAGKIITDDCLIIENLDHMESKIKELLELETYD